MKPDPRFGKQDKSFWACVRSLSQEIGYTVHRQDRIRIPSIEEMRDGFINLELNPEAIVSGTGKPTKLASLLHDYFSYRAHVLETIASKKLLNAEQARNAFEVYRKKLKPTELCPLPMNKQKGEKKAHAYLTCLVNMFVEHYSGQADCDYDPRKLTTVTRDGVPLRTLARRVDGAFPSSVNPVAIWEVKEYYYTTTFGSRIADGVYESLLDGLELEELRENKSVDIKHYLMVDAHDTWWNDGKAYLCRIVDMVNMGYVDEVLFGLEVIEELPRIVREWTSLAKRDDPRGEADPPASP